MALTAPRIFIELLYQFRNISRPVSGHLRGNSLRGGGDSILNNENPVILALEYLLDQYIRRKTKRIFESGPGVPHGINSDSHRISVISIKRFHNPGKRHP